MTHITLIVAALLAVDLIVYGWWQTRDRDTLIVASTVAAFTVVMVTSAAVGGSAAIGVATVVAAVIAWDFARRVVRVHRLNSAATSGPTTSPTGGPVPAFRDGVLWVPQPWMDDHDGMTEQAQAVHIRDTASRLPEPQRVMLTRAALSAAESGDRIPVRLIGAGGGR